jgi:hypothetical protein
MIRRLIESNAYAGLEKYWKLLKNEIHGRLLPVAPELVVLELTLV